MGAAVRARLVLATQAEVASHIGLTQSAVSRRVKAGILPAPQGRGGYDLDACRVAELRNLRAVLAGRADDVDEPDADGYDPRALERAQIELTERKAEVETLKVAQLRREVIEIAVVAELWARAFARIKASR